jgi:hypothetical protein
MNDFEINPNAKEQYFSTPEGREISWTTLLLLKSEILLATSEEIEINTALKIADIVSNYLENK